jgi:hypothetical protein
VKNGYFSYLVPVQSPQEIEEKNAKEYFFLGIWTGPNTPIFGPKQFWLHLVSGTTFKKKIRKLKTFFVFV